jgi:hypothetical protein
MSSLFAGFYQAPLQLVTGANVPLISGGVFLTGASVQIVFAGTSTPANVYASNAAYQASTPALANPLPYTSTSGGPGVDAQSNCSFYADAYLSYDALVTYGPVSDPITVAFRIPHLTPDAHPPIGTTTGTVADGGVVATNTTNIATNTTAITNEVTRATNAEGVLRTTISGLAATAWLANTAYPAETIVTNGTILWQAPSGGVPARSTFTASDWIELASIALPVGTTPGTVAAGDDSRFAGSAAGTAGRALSATDATTTNTRTPTDGSVTTAKLASGGVALPTGSTATTQARLDASAKVATTGYADAAVSALSATSVQIAGGLGTDTAIVAAANALVTSEASARSTADGVLANGVSANAAAITSEASTARAAEATKGPLLSVATAAFTVAGALVVNQLNVGDATAGAITPMTLPTGQAAGSFISVGKAGTDATTNPITITGNMRGVAAQSIVLSLVKESVLFLADAAGSWWPFADHKPLASLDARYVVANVPAPTGVVATDTANVLAALTATSGGGRVNFQAGTYKINTFLTYYASTTWAGTGSGTTLQLTVDLYASGLTAPYWIAPNGPGDFGKLWTMENLSLQGPGAYSLGNCTCKTAALQLNSFAQVRRCSIKGFFSGVAIWGASQMVSQCSLNNNYYGLDFVDGRGVGGSQSFEEIDLTGNNLAGLHISGADAMNGVTAYNVHTGFSPVGIFKTDSQNGWDGNGNPTYVGGTPSSFSAVTNFQFLAFIFEQIGNCAILDISTGTGNLTIGTGTWVGFAIHTLPNATYSTTNAPLNNAAYQGAWAIYARSASAGGRIITDEYPVPAGSVGGIFVASGGFCLEVQVPTGLPAALFGSGSTWTYNQGAMSVVCRTGGKGGTSTSEAWVYQSQGVVNVGDLVELVPGPVNCLVRRSTGPLPLFGVAMTPGVANGAILVQQNGAAGTMNFVGTTTIQAGNAISCNTATPYLADLASLNPTMPVIGVAVQGGATPTATLAGVRLTPGRVPIGVGPNLLTANDATMAQSTTGWAATTNVTLAAAAVAPQVNTVLTGMSLTSAAAGLMKSALNTSHRVPVTALQTYTIMASFQAAATPETVLVIGTWYNSGGASLGTFTSPAVSDAVGSWVTASQTAIAPAGAVTCGVTVEALTTAGASEVHYVTCVGVFQGFAVYWANVADAQGAAALAAAASVPLSTVTTAGDLFVATGAGVIERLGTGTSGQTLQVGGADPSGLQWATPSASAGVNAVSGDGGVHSSGGANPDISLAAVPNWAATTIYTQGQVVVCPSGGMVAGVQSLVQANTSFTSGGSFLASNWTRLSDLNAYQAMTEIVTATGSHNAPAWATRLRMRMTGCGGDGSGGASMGNAVVSTTLTNGSLSGTTLALSTVLPQAIASGATITVKDGVGGTQAFTLTAAAAVNAATVTITSATVTIATGSGYTAWGTTWAVAGGSGGGPGQEVVYEIAVTPGAAGTATIGAVGSGGVGGPVGGNAGAAGTTAGAASFAIGGVTYLATPGSKASGPAANSPTYANAGLYGAHNASETSAANPGYPGQGAAAQQPVPIGSLWGGPNGKTATPLLGGTGGTGYQLGANNANNPSTQTGTTAGGNAAVSNAFGCGGAGGGAGAIGGAGGNGSPGGAGVIYLTWMSA